MSWSRTRRLHDLMLRSTAARGVSKHPQVWACGSVRRDAPSALLRTRGGWAKGITVLATLALAATLAGCFQPLYSEAAHPGLVEDLRAIEVEPIKDRIGHYLGDNLITALNGTGQTSTPKYKLTVTVSMGTSTPTVSSLTNVATSATVTAEAHYILNKADGGARVLTGVASANASYDRSQQRYNDLRAARDAEIRLARSLADEISLRLAAQLAGKTS